jgi:hypothetical protein
MGLSRGDRPDAKGTPLSVRIASGSPNALNARSKTVNAKVSCVLDMASQVSAWRARKEHFGKYRAPSSRT